MITITSKTEGFRRAGVAHSATPTEYPDDAFTAEQLAALLTEPMLTVVAVGLEPAPTTKKGKR